MAWEANLERCHAEYRLRFTNLGGAELEDIRDLAELATGDKEQAEDVMMNAYEQRLWAAVENANGSDGFRFPA